MPVTANPSPLCCQRCDKHWVVMCKTPVKSPVNTGEQPTPETAPSLTETNGQSQPLPFVVPAEDWVQPPPEQVALPTATDVSPELPSSGDIAPLPAAYIGESRKLPDDCKTVTTGVKQKKCKRINGNVECNLRKSCKKALVLIAQVILVPKSHQTMNSPLILRSLKDAVEWPGTR